MAVFFNEMLAQTFIMPVVFGNMKMSFRDKKKGQLEFSKS